MLLFLKFSMIQNRRRGIIAQPLVSGSPYFEFFSLITIIK
ncbi:hypothetical protein HMPREF9371_1521 [Neisseria shayeganii 871]|uniref:Uncharacterized protein n=1 Tax=Neisseria shayeganii 871 TaxID=1032488 RepID=G4CIT2_9NEIS|nr:hypothetical protein HMPREF9371_1521 [Neisseria shayeganii 871]